MRPPSRPPRASRRASCAPRRAGAFTDTHPHPRFSLCAACNNVNRALGDYAIGEAVRYSIIVDGNTAQVLTDKDGTMAPYAYSWLDASTQGAPFPLYTHTAAPRAPPLPRPLTPTPSARAPAVYFKSGNYLQSTGPSPTRGAVVKITALSTSHRG